MKVISRYANKKPAYIFTFLLLMTFIFSLTVVWQTGKAQQAQLSLADILIGLRSKKATLEERNTLLADAVKKRGITFSLTPEIEKELANTGASAQLIEAIRQKSSKIIPTVATPSPTPIYTPTPATIPTLTPVPTPTPPVLDFAFYQKRGSAYLFGKKYDLAVTEYNKALELNSNDAPTYLNRGIAFLNLKNFSSAVADFDKAIELNPKESMMYFNRGDLHEKMGNLDKAISDYQKAFDLDNSNEPAKANLQRLKAEHSNTLPKTTIEVSSSSSENATTPTILNVGSLNELAINLALPVYSAIDRQRNLQGVVTVQVMLDEKGKVISAKAIAGPASLRSISEAAALKSRFKPALISNRPVKAIGIINYNFKAN